MRTSVQFKETMSGLTGAFDYKHESAREHQNDES